MHPYILMIFVVLMYAGNILTGKAINELPPLTIAFFRLLVAFMVIFPIGYKSAREYSGTFMELKKPFLVMTLTGVTFFNTFIYGSLQFTTASKVSILETVIPVVTVILSAIFLKEHLGKVQWLGIVLSFVGALWVVMGGKIRTLTGLNWNIGDAIMIGAILCWSIYSIFVKRYMHHFPAYGALLVMTGISVIVLFPLVMVEWMLAGVPDLVHANLWSGLLYLGIFPSFIALLCYNRAVDQLGASQASIFLNFLPVVTMAGAFLWLGERITFMQIVGTLVVITGVLLTTQVRKKGSIHIKNKTKFSTTK
ncbi:DMT family transporter [Virgibacillus sp. MSP4-1]|uniref:DMT family transporter n=1 Tax=Virgibacillus sp. MSP4-1 TaxID=2700081 RepID=UPI00039E5489|nr:DMT family transporter [Virgibacillus sp. MSP4-1]QHS21877.1 DMT family transporter [Virgibacillus sp. MSP4-1]